MFFDNNSHLKIFMIHIVPFAGKGYNKNTNGINVFLIPML